MKHRGGRPLRTPELGDGRRVGLSLRVTPEYKAKLDQAAQRSGRSLSQEIEHYIELGIHFETLLRLSRAALDGIAPDCDDSPAMCHSQNEIPAQNE